MATIKTFEEACKALGISKALPSTKLLSEKHRLAINAHYQLVIIAEALNEGWKPNWNDQSEYKWFPWFTVKASKNKPSGSGLSFYGAVNWSSNAGVGSRLCYKSREIAEYAGTHFKELYEQSYLLD